VWLMGYGKSTAPRPLRMADVTLATPKWIAFSEYPEHNCSD
jgi:hypothetical protein